jgi:hypothetical protein
MGDDSLQQGDILLNCPVLIPPDCLPSSSSGKEIPIDYQILNVVVMTQSCDLENKKVKLVAVCPVYQMSDYLKELPDHNKKTAKAVKAVFKTLKDGHAPTYHLLNQPPPSFTLREHLVVDFRNIHSIHIDAMPSLVKEQAMRVRLNSPYTEHLSQAFARSFMRVGLPSNIESDGQEYYTTSD